MSATLAGRHEPINILKKNLNACIPSVHLFPHRGENVKTLRWDHRLRKQNLFIAFGSPMVVTLGQEYNLGEKPTVILYTYINCAMQGHQKTF